MAGVENTPWNVASQLLTQFNGVQREAESAAWERVKKTEPGSPQRQTWMMVVNCILEGTELPPVPRKPYAPHLEFGA
jgi:hypothetical protein